jgi:methionyl-tRNA formyltransferase
MKIICLTGMDLRHGAFIEYIESYFDIDLIIREQKNADLKLDHDIILNFYSNFKNKQIQYFPYENIKTRNIINISAGQINSDLVINNIKQVKPDLMIVFGVGLLGSEILSLNYVTILNIHTGITHLFRGVDSAFWAIYNHQPEGVGATIHQIDKTIDTGAIVLQECINIEQSDDVYDLFFKSVKLGFALMKESIDTFELGKLQFKKNKKQGKLYQNSDMLPEAILYVTTNTHNILADYLHKK